MHTLDIVNVLQHMHRHGRGEQDIANKSNNIYLSILTIVFSELLQISVEYKKIDDDLKTAG